MRRYAVVRFQVVGYHQWLHAPKETSFLRSKHRHNFHIEVAVSVDHSDRELEFFDMKERLARIYPQGYDFGESSCEEIAEGIIAIAKWTWPGRDFRVGVFEDGENGAVVVEEG